MKRYQPAVPPDVAIDMDFAATKDQEQTLALLNNYEDALNEAVELLRNARVAVRMAARVPGEQKGLSWLNRKMIDFISLHGKAPRP
jgi:hypothetical protein